MTVVDGAGVDGLPGGLVAVADGAAPQQPEEAPLRELGRAGEPAGLGRAARAGVHRIFATGMGRESVALADAHRTPMLSHARGAHWWFPGARTVIDVGADAFADGGDGVS